MGNKDKTTDEITLAEADFTQSNNPVVQELGSKKWIISSKKSTNLDDAYSNLYTAFLDGHLGCNHRVNFYEKYERDVFETRNRRATQRIMVDTFMQKYAPTKDIIPESDMQMLLAFWDDDIINFPYDSLMSSLDLPPEFANHHLRVRKKSYLSYERNKWLLDIKTSNIRLVDKKIRPAEDGGEDDNRGLHLTGEVNTRFELTNEGFRLVDHHASTPFLHKLIMEAEVKLSKKILEKLHQSFLLDQAICKLNTALYSTRQTQKGTNAKENPYDVVIRTVEEARTDAEKDLIPYEKLREIIQATEDLLQHGQKDRNKILAYKKLAHSLSSDPLTHKIAKAMLSVAGGLLLALGIGALIVTNGASLALSIPTITLGTALIGAHGFLLFKGPKEKPLTKSMLDLASTFQPPNMTMEEKVEQLKKDRKEVGELMMRVGKNVKGMS